MGWDSLKDVPEKIFLRFKYILMEFHLEENGSLELYYNVLKKRSKIIKLFIFIVITETLLLLEIIYSVNFLRYHMLLKKIIHLM